MCLIGKLEKMRYSFSLGRKKETCWPTKDSFSVMHQVFTIQLDFQVHLLTSNNAKIKKENMMNKYGAKLQGFD